MPKIKVSVWFILGEKKERRREGRGKERQERVLLPSLEGHRATRDVRTLVSDLWTVPGVTGRIRYAQSLLAKAF